MKKWLWVLLGAIGFFWAAFWYLDFRIAASSTQAEKNITTTGLGMGDGLPDAMQRRGKINLALVGEAPLIAALQKVLPVAMKDARIAELELVQGIEPKYQSPVLVVKVDSLNLLWTPFFATSQITIQAGYSSTGDTTLIGETPVTISNQNGPALAMYGEYKVSDRSWGLISRPGYHQHLANDLAKQIVATLKDLYRV